MFTLAISIKSKHDFEEEVRRIWEGLEGENGREKCN